jgi:hypothetical protein
VIIGHISPSTVARHARAVTAVVDVCSKLDHPYQTVAAAATAADG